MKESKRPNLRYLTATAMLSAISFLLFFLQFSTPITPSFLKLDVSDLPALIGSFSMGPVAGVVICLVKNLLHLLMTTTGGVGELSNFILGAAFVLPAGLIYYRRKTKKTALIGSLVGAACMAAVSFPSNLFLVYPVYYNFMPKETILNMYQAILPAIKSIEQSLLIFNVPFTFVKGMLCVLITFLIYKRISPLIKGNRKKTG
ncbi:MAG: ECF transporter S component [Lachnospiraceae bacterium]|nr:ECF transporter S component [Lachnospiraceae bacterium]MBQ7506069.1 ECF transporter S component [Lachnospiraceae bacterium]